MPLTSMSLPERGRGRFLERYRAWRGSRLARQAPGRDLGFPGRGAGTRPAAAVRAN
jgi:hypothetical protein